MEAVLTDTEKRIIKAKEIRVALKAIVADLKAFKSSLGHSEAAAHATISMRHVEDASMRLGLTLHELGQDSPYPNSVKPENTIVDAAAPEAPTA